MLNLFLPTPTPHLQSRCHTQICDPIHWKTKHTTESRTTWNKGIDLKQSRWKGRVGNLSSSVNYNLWGKQVDKAFGDVERIIVRWLSFIYLLSRATRHLVMYVTTEPHHCHSNNCANVNRASTNIRTHAHATFAYAHIHAHTCKHTQTCMHTRMHRGAFKTVRSQCSAWMNALSQNRCNVRMTTGMINPVISNPRLRDMRRSPHLPGRPFWSQHNTNSYLWEIQRAPPSPPPHPTPQKRKEKNIYICTRVDTPNPLTNTS